MVSSFHQLLLALAVLDIIYVATNIVDYSIVKVSAGYFLFMAAKNTTKQECKNYIICNSQIVYI